MIAQTEGRLARGMLLIAVTGVALGLAYNASGLRAEPAWGLSWITAAPEELPELDGISSEGEVTPSDDPMAIPAVAGSGALQEIPDLGRPIQMQLPAVKRYFDAGAVFLVDAREPEEYAEGHIAGAINLPFDHVITDPERLEGLDPEGKPIVTYCGGGSCELSLNLAWELIRTGQSRVLVFMGGYPEWESAGYPIESGAGEE